MDDKSGPFRIQPGDGKSYTVSEYLALIEPQFREQRETIRQCIDGLTVYASNLAAKRQEEQIPQLRRICVEMSGSWGLDEPKQYPTSFDEAISEARRSGQGSALDEKTRQDILKGLELYAKEMMRGGGMEQWIIECDILAEQLQVEWRVMGGEVREMMPTIGM